MPNRNDLNLGTAVTASKPIVTGFKGSKSRAQGQLYFEILAPNGTWRIEIKIITICTKITLIIVNCNIVHKISIHKGVGRRLIATFFIYQSCKKNYNCYDIIVHRYNADILN